MNHSDIGFLGLAGSAVLVTATAAISAWKRLGLERGVLWAAASGR